LKLSLRRLMAYWIDFVLLAFKLVGFQWLLYTITSGFPFDQLNNGYLIEAWVLLSVSLPVWLYFICSEYYRRQTIGKRLLSVKVMSIEGSTLTWRQALLRTFIKLLPWELTHIIILIPEPWYRLKDSSDTSFLIYIPNIIILLYIVILFVNKGEKGLHDFTAKTKVEVELKI